MNRAVFLDRDGTLNVDKGYVWRREDWEWIPGALEALAGFKRMGFLTVVATNQSGVARGMYGEEDVRRLHGWAAADAAARGAALDAFYHCPHLEGCECRKPKPGMLLRAAREWDIDLKSSWMVGDRLRDVEAGLAAGAGAVLLDSPRPEAPPAGAVRAADLAAAYELIRKGTT